MTSPMTGPMTGPTSRAAKRRKFRRPAAMPAVDCVRDAKVTPLRNRGAGCGLSVVPARDCCCVPAFRGRAADTGDHAVCTAEMCPLFRRRGNQDTLLLAVTSTPGTQKKSHWERGAASWIAGGIPQRSQGKRGKGVTAPGRHGKGKGSELLMQASREGSLSGNQLADGRGRIPAVSRLGRLILGDRLGGFGE